MSTLTWITERARARNKKNKENEFSSEEKHENVLATMRE